MRGGVAFFTALAAPEVLSAGVPRHPPRPCLQHRRGTAAPGTLVPTSFASPTPFFPQGPGLPPLLVLRPPGRASSVADCEGRLDSRRAGMEVFTQQLINGITLGSIYGLIAIGYT